METTPALANEPVPSLSFSPWAWQAFDGEGKRINDAVGNGYSCLDSTQVLPSDMGPGQSISGVIVLDVAATTGTLALLPQGSGGWEWNY